MIHKKLDGDIGENDFSPSLQIYYNDLKKCAPISKKKERELLIKAKNGDIEARNKVLTSNLKFVFEMAKIYRGQGVDMAELISEGNEGMIRAIEKIDLNYQNKFYSYAVWWIRQRMSAAIMKKKNQGDMEKSFDDTFKTEEKSNVSFENISNEDYNEPDGTKDIEDNAINLYEFKEDEKIKHIVVEKLLDKLNDREKTIIIKYFGIENDDNGEELGQISKQLNLTTERVRQLKVKAINLMRNEVFCLEEAQSLF